MNSKIGQVYILEDNEGRILWFRKKFRNIHYTHNPIEFVEWIINEKEEIFQIFLDHDLGFKDFSMSLYGQELTGMYVVDQIINKQLDKTLPILIHSENNSGRPEEMEKRLKENGYINIKRIRFTTLIKQYK